ncbi:MAG: hypothetical protein NVS9B12_00320 [Vulcanimicrobiaceae bacterium]
MDGRLLLAQESYAAGDFLRAFAICKEVLDEQPDSVNALVLFGQLCLISGEYLTAVQCLRLARQIEPDHAISGIPNADEIAADAYADALAIDPGLANHTSAFLFAAGVPQVERAEALLREVIALEPANAEAHAALGNLLGRGGDLEGALDEYARAVVLAPQNAGVRLGYAERLRLSGENRRAREQFAVAMELERTFHEPPSAQEELRLIVLCAPDFWENNVLVDLLVDREHVHVTKHFVGQRNAPVPQGHTVFCAIADPLNAAALEAAGDVVAALPAVPLNNPGRLSRTSRTFLFENAPPHPQLIVPQCVATNTAELDVNAPPVHFPLLIRPADSHRGLGLGLVANAEELLAYVRVTPSSDVVLSNYVDYASPDSYYRKYRFIFIEGRPYPYHLAISSQWMVHYFSAPMENHQWMREEEARFLTAPLEAFGDGRGDALGVIAETIELDYFGLDCAIVGESVLVFEANANMLVQNFYDKRLFAYKEPAFDRIRAAFNAMIRERRSPL